MTRNSQITNYFDWAHRWEFMCAARAAGHSRQWARYQWMRRVRGQAIAKDLLDLFDQVTEMIGAHRFPKLKGIPDEFTTSRDVPRTTNSAPESR